MQFLALMVFILVALCGGYLFKRHFKGIKTHRWMIKLHGLAGGFGFIILLMGLIRGYWSDWGWISLGMFTLLLVGAFFMFEKWFKKRKTPLILIATHATFALACISVLMYSLVTVN